MEIEIGVSFISRIPPCFGHVTTATVPLRVESNQARLSNSSINNPIMLKQLLSKLVLPNLEQVRCNDVCYLYRGSFSFFSLPSSSSLEDFFPLWSVAGGFCYSIIFSAYHYPITYHSHIFFCSTALPPIHSPLPLLSSTLSCVFFCVSFIIFSLLYIILQYILFTLHIRIYHVPWVAR